MRGLSSAQSSIFHPEGRGVLKSASPLIVDPRGVDIDVPQPDLHLGDVGLVVQCVGGGRGSQAVHTQFCDFDTRRFGIFADERIDAIGTDAGTGRASAQWQKQRRLAVELVMRGRFQVRIDPLRSHRVQGQKSQLVAFAVDTQVLDAASLLQVCHHQ